ncbi:MAG: thymidine phosphorylase [Bacilli bacterium]|nr:thymidine phosphorylase [Bacilli bacterium]
MDILEIISKKEKSLELGYDELEYAVMGYVNGRIPDYQMSVFLEAVKIYGMTDREVIELTDIMLNSGEVIELGFDLVDKHSTGGVGDKTTLVLCPLVSSLGVSVAKMSGRGLGHTGGTIDKLESIRGFNTELSLDELKEQVKEIGIALVGQMGNLCPADKKIYALRDVTGTVKSIPLIASSIMSKKLASGAKKIVIDLKVGNGALLNTMEEALELARVMVKIGHLKGRKTVCVLTNMDQPLGYAIGNSLEVIEAIDTLKGNGPDDLKELVINLGALMLTLDKDITFENALEHVENALKDGRAYEKFKEVVKHQGGDINNIPVADKVVTLKSKSAGYIKSIDALKLGELAKKLGAGRQTKEDNIDLSVGLVLHKKVSEKVEIDEDLISIYYGDKQISEEEVLGAFEIVKEKQEKPALIYKIVKE